MMDGSKDKKHLADASSVAATLAAFYGSQITRCRLDQTADNVHPTTLHLLSRRTCLHGSAYPRAMVCPFYI
jgi:hypothetical protein